MIPDDMILRIEDYMMSKVDRLVEKCGNASARLVTKKLQEALNKVASRRPMKPHEKRCLYKYASQNKCPECLTTFKNKNCVDVHM